MTVPKPQRARRRSDGARGWFLPARDATFDYLPDGQFVTQEGALAGTPLPYFREELEFEDSDSPATRR